MSASALAWGLATNTGSPLKNLALIQMSADVTADYGGWLHTGSVKELAERCSASPNEMANALIGLAEDGLIAEVGGLAPTFGWVLDPQPGMDLHRIWVRWLRGAMPARTAVPAALRLAVHRRDDFRCQHCDWAPIAPDGYDGSYALTGVDRGGRVRRLEVDHVQPVSVGGRTEMGNLQSLCGPCNALKGTRPAALAAR